MEHDVEMIAHADSPPTIEAGPDAVRAASVFHFGELRIGPSAAPGRLSTGAVSQRARTRSTAPLPRRALYTATEADVVALAEYGNVAATRRCGRPGVTSPLASTRDDQSPDGPLPRRRPGGHHGRQPVRLSAHPLAEGGETELAGVAGVG